MPKNKNNFEKTNFEFFSRLNLLRAKIEDNYGECYPSLRNCSLYKRNNSKVWGMIIPCQDMFQSEYIEDCDKRLEWISGFSGSAGIAIIGESRAAIFADGRYTQQAKQEVDQTLFEVKDLNLVEIKHWLLEKEASNQTLLYDPNLHTKSQIDNYNKHFSEIGVTLRPVMQNLIDEIWPDQPDPSSHSFFPHPIEFSGKATEDKVKDVIKVINTQKASLILLCDINSASWLLNIRGNDSKNTPFCKMFLLIDSFGKITAFTELKKVTPAVKAHCGKNVSWQSFDKIYGVLRSISGVKIITDFSQLPQAIYLFAQNSLTHATDPCLLGRAIKNETEQQGAINANKRDSIAVINTLGWISKEISDGNFIKESDVVRYILNQRNALDKFHGPSFETIAGAGANGAIIHYIPKPEKGIDAHLQSEFETVNTLLLDSGGQYNDGTTDITRTIAIRSPEKIPTEIKVNFTRVLRGHIALAQAVFPIGTTGQQLDCLARQYLWQKGLDFQHGTGHGVGSFLNVHEGPHYIGKGKGGDHAALVPGMIVSNEPGYYKNNEYGIRIESLLMVVESEFEGFLCFKTLPLVPIDKNLMENTMLSKEEISWLNNYHSLVRSEMIGLVDKSYQQWLIKATEAID